MDVLFNFRAWGLGLAGGLESGAWSFRKEHHVLGIRPDGACCEEVWPPTPKSETTWEFPKIRGTLFGGPYNQDPII